MKMLVEMHFAMQSPASCSVRPRDLNSIADLGEKQDLPKIATLIFMYLGSSDAPKTRGGGAKMQLA